jgi:hypothetical protein
LVNTSGDYSDTLRAVGRYLDEVGATDVMISQEPDDLMLVWRGEPVSPGGSPDGRKQALALAPGEVQALRTTARLFRGRERHRVRFPLSELLRTIGTLADDLRAVELRIAETSTGFELTGWAQGEPVRQVFTYAELVARAHAHYRWRVDRTGAPPAKT